MKFPLAAQIRRIFNDDGKDDKVFLYQEHRLKAAMIKLADATNQVIRASQTFQALMLSNERPDQLH